MKRHRTVTISDGTKLREVRTETGTSTAIDWCGDLVLEKVGSGTKAAKRLRLDGGYVDLTSSTPAKRHFVRDHLGSIRAVVDDTGTSLETDDYYPLGGPLPTGTATALQPEKYQGKEWNTAAGFNVYDFGARLYDPGLGRWLSLDPMTEQYYFHSPYLFCAGNPMKFVDPSGLIWYSINQNGYIEVVDEEADGPDRLYYRYPAGGTGPMMNNDYIEITNKQILQTLSVQNGKYLSRDEVWSDSEELAKVFSFVSSHSDVEWLIRSYKRPDNSFYYNLATDHNSGSVSSGFVDRRFHGVSEQDLYAQIHSHPGKVYSAPSGDFNNLQSSEYSDAINIRSVFMRIYGQNAPLFFNGRPYFYMYHPYSGSLTRYTMYNQSLSKRTIQSNTITSDAINPHHDFISY